MGELSANDTAEESASATTTSSISTTTTTTATTSASSDSGISTSSSSSLTDINKTSSPHHSAVTNHGSDADSKAPRYPERSRDLFGVQLEVTSLMLEAERRKLNVLQRELQIALEEGGSIKAKEHQRQELIVAISRIQAQHDHLEKEYHQHAIGVLRGSGKSNRSQPAIGLKQTPKARPTIFGTVASDQTPKDGSSRRSLPQTSQSVGGKSLSNGGGGGASGACAVAAGERASSCESVPDSTLESDNALVYRDGNLVSGSLDALVQHTVPTGDYYPDRAYLFAFLLSARLFIKPHELLGEVCALCDAQQNLGDKHLPAKERLGRFVPHLVQLLGEWTETFPYDFRDERVMAHVRGITHKCVSVEPSVRKEVSTLLQNLLVRLTTLEKYEEFLQRINADAQTAKIENLSQVDMTELCPTPALLAQQLTHVELERLSYIGPEEFVQAFAKESPHLETSFKDMKKTRNLESYVQWFNRLSYFVATEVCKHVKKKQRVKVMEFWIETARECFNIGNFNSLMAIIAGLNMSPISRLKKTWSKVQSAKFSILEHQMDPSSNFSSYRSTLKAAMWRSAGATDERQRIVIPFFSLLVKDLYFLNEGCSNKLPNGHINFEKFWQLAKQVTEFITWKQVTCPFEKNPKVIHFLQASPVLTENALALASFECEPPENNHEKERYKALKSELMTA